MSDQPSTGGSVDDTRKRQSRCPECDTWFKSIGIHWSQSSCDPPTLTQFQRDVAIGVTMGDGSVYRSNSNHARLDVGMTSRPYLEYLNNVFEPFSNGVTFKQSAEECATDLRERGFSPNAQAEDCKDMYRMTTTHVPEFDFLAEWYETGEKVFPADIELTPTVLRHWYAGDGTLRQTGNTRHMEIAMANEVDRRDRIESLFNAVGIDVGRWDITERTDGSRRCSAVFSRDQSDELLAYMGYPVPGFRYKWPDDWRTLTRADR